MAKDTNLYNHIAYGIENVIQGILSLYGNV